ncbi:MAG: phosphoribosylglycinamide formyltransferase [Deltaproteobacteria bacterium]|nr:phosphoribosylglycinamide formyltransferase [Deltaproteobacteria bacterium]
MRSNTGDGKAKRLSEKLRKVKKLKLGVLVSGGGTNLQAIIDAIEAGKVNAAIKIVVSDNPSAGAIARAKKHGIETAIITKGTFPSREAFDDSLVKTLKEKDVGLVALAGFMRILTPAFIREFKDKIINIHPALLPALPGLHVQKKAIDHGVKFSGATVHFVDEGVDSGPIIIQAVVPVLDDDTPETLSGRILKEEHRIYPQAIELFGQGRLRIEGRRVIVKDADVNETSLENPMVTIFEKK